MFPTNYHDAVKSGFVPYILEASGRDDFCTTRTAKLNSAIKDFKYLVSIGENPNAYIHQVLSKHGLDEKSLSSREIRRINELK